MSPATVKKYTAAGIDPTHPDARVQYHKWRKRQAAEDKKSDKPSPVSAAERRLTRNEVMSPVFKAEAKLQEWAVEIRKLVEVQQDARRKRRESDAETERLFLRFLESREAGLKIRTRIDATQSRLTHFRDMVRRRKSSIAAKQYHKEANLLRKKLGLPPVH